MEGPWWRIHGRWRLALLQLLCTPQRLLDAVPAHAVPESLKPPLESYPPGSPQAAALALACSL